MVRWPKLVWALLCLFKKNSPKIKNRAWVHAPVDAPRWELFIRDLGSVVVLLVSRQIIFVWPFWWPIQLYCALILEIEFWDHGKEESKNAAVSRLLMEQEVPLGLSPQSSAPASWLEDVYFKWGITKDAAKFEGTASQLAMHFGTGLGPSPRWHQRRCQLSRLSSLRSRWQKINLPTNQKGYDTFETSVGKLSRRRIQICFDYFCLGIILKVILNHSQNDA